MELAIHLTEGSWGAAKDLERATRLNEMACRAGSPAACDNLGHHYSTLGDPESTQCAARLLRDSCDADFMHACTRLSILLLPSKRAKALWLLQRACDNSYQSEDVPRSYGSG